MEQTKQESMRNFDLRALGAIIFLSVGLALFANYYSFVYVVALCSTLGMAILFFHRPEWFLYILALSKISLGAFQIVAFQNLEMQRRSALGLDGIITAVLLFCSTIYFLKHKDINIFTPPAAKPYMVFLMISFISLAYSADKLIGIRRLSNYASYLVMYLLTVHLLDTERKTLKLAMAMCGSCLIPLLIGFYQEVAPQGVSHSFPSYNRIFSTAAFPVAYGYYLMLMLIFCLSLYMYVPSLKTRLSLLVLMSLLLISLVLTYYRGGWFGLILAIAVFTAMLVPRMLSKGFILPMFIFIIIVFLVVGISIPSIIRRLYDLTSSNNNLAYRFTAWRFYFQEFLRRPLFGHGLGSFLQIGKERLFHLTNPHNCYLLVMVETGIVGLLAYLATLFSLLRFALKAYRDHLKSRKMIMASGFTAMLFAVLLTQYTDDALTLDVPFTYFWLFAGIVYNLTREREFPHGISQGISHNPHS